MIKIYWMIRTTYWLVYNLIVNRNHKQIIDFTFSALGYETHIRILPNEFIKDCRYITELDDQNKFVEARIQIDKAYQRWGCDEDLVRLGTFNSFMLDEEQSNDNQLDKHSEKN